MITIQLRFYEELNDFLPLDKRKMAFEHSITQKMSIKDVIESLGVPHTEIDLILVNGRPVDFTYQIHSDDRISVYPVFESFDISGLTRLRPTPLRKLRFILDVHLGKLAKYLRLLGQNVIYEKNYSDEIIVDRSYTEHLIVITRDIGLLKNKKITHGYWIRNKDPNKQILEVVERFDLLKQCRPFSRCLECNGEIKQVKKNKITRFLSPMTVKYYDHFTQCQSCKKIYWKGTHYKKLKQWIKKLEGTTNHFRIFLCGDVMTGRGIDQILPFPCHPHLHENYVNDARDYVYLAESQNGKIAYPVTAEYIWGDALTIWQTLKPNIKIVNLETAITTSDDYYPDKGIHYRMNPRNIEIFITAGIDICTLANNHILDWGIAGLNETLATLSHAHIQSVGAGENKERASQPAIIELNEKYRVLVFASGTTTSGVPSQWQATFTSTGVNYLSEMNQQELDSITANIQNYKKPGDLVVFSIHWGSNWGYTIPKQLQQFAHHLIEEATVDVVFGHSSHHPRAIEIYHGKPILYGCGDFINDYEGIAGYDEYRGDLSLMYFLDFDRETLELKQMQLVPLQIKQFSLHLASKNDREWLLRMLNHGSAEFGVQFILRDDYFMFDSLAKKF